MLIRRQWTFSGSHWNVPCRAIGTLSPSSGPVAGLERLGCCRTRRGVVRARAGGGFGEKRLLEAERWPRHGRDTAASGDSLLVDALNRLGFELVRPVHDKDLAARGIEHQRSLSVRGCLMWPQEDAFQPHGLEARLQAFDGVRVGPLVAVVEL